MCSVYNNILECIVLEILHTFSENIRVVNANVWTFEILNF